MRISIPQHHRQFVSNLAQEMGCNQSEALNYLLWQHRWGTPTQLPKQLNQINQQPIQNIQPIWEPAFEAFTPKSPQAIQDFEHTQLHQEIDPIISKFAALIEEF